MSKSTSIDLLEGTVLNREIDFFFPPADCETMVSKDECWTRFERASRQIFSNWTLLRLAVDQCWGGRKSNQKAELFFQNTVQTFREAATLKNQPVLVADLADYLNDQVLELFSAETDDNSDEEVAQLLVDLFQACGRGDFSIADQIAEDGAVDPKTCQRNVKEGHDDTDESSGSDEELTDSIESKSVNDTKEKNNNEPDEDGWHTVPIRRR